MGADNWKFGHCMGIVENYCCSHACNIIQVSNHCSEACCVRYVQHARYCYNSNPMYA